MSFLDFEEEQILVDHKQGRCPGSFIIKAKYFFDSIIHPKGKIVEWNKIPYLTKEEEYSRRKARRERIVKRDREFTEKFLDKGRDI